MRRNCHAIGELAADSSSYVARVVLLFLRRATLTLLVKTQLGGRSHRAKRVHTYISLATCFLKVSFRLANSHSINEPYTNCLSNFRDFQWSIYCPRLHCLTTQIWIGQEISTRKRIITLLKIFSDLSIGTYEPLYLYSRVLTVSHINAKTKPKSKWHNLFG